MDGKLFPALQNVDIPISLGSQNVMLNTDIVSRDITLLLSRKSMKKINTTIDFTNDHAVIFDQSIQLIVKNQDAVLSLKTHIKQF